MNYRIILVIACLVLGLRYVADSDASVPGRWVVGAAVVASFVLPDGVWWTTAGVLLQLAVSLFVLFWMQAQAHR